MRPASLDDLEAVLAVVRARDIADLGAPDYTLGALRDEWGREGFHVGRDAVVIEDGGEQGGERSDGERAARDRERAARDREGAARGRIVAAAWIRRRQSLALVHPAAEGRGHGAALLAWVQAREAELGRAVHRQEVAGAGAQRLLERAGYRHITSFHRMQIDFATRAPAAPRWPAGVRARPLDAEGDAEPLWRLAEAGFAAVPSWQPGTLADFRTGDLGASDLDRELTFVAEADGRPAGLAFVHRDAAEPEAFVSLVAVDPAVQGRGIGSAVLAEALERSRAAGLERTVLWVDADNPRALGLYERAGMERRGGAARYERPVS